MNNLTGLTVCTGGALPSHVFPGSSDGRSFDPDLPLYQEDLRTTLLDVIDRSLREIEHVDEYIIVDSSYIISRKGFEDVCGSLCDEHGKHLKKCYKGISQNNPCVRIADFVAGAVGQCYNRTDDSYLELLRERLIDARK